MNVSRFVMRRRLRQHSVFGWEYKENSGNYSLEWSLVIGASAALVNYASIIILAEKEATHTSPPSKRKRAASSLSSASYATY